MQVRVTAIEDMSGDTILVRFDVEDTSKQPVEVLASGTTQVSIDVPKNKALARIQREAGRLLQEAQARDDLKTELTGTTIPLSYPLGV